MPRIFYVSKCYITSKLGTCYCPNLVKQSHSSDSKIRVSNVHTTRLYLSENSRISRFFLSWDFPLPPLPISLSKHVHVQFCGKKRVQAFVVVIASSDLSCDLIWWILHALYNQQLLTTRSDLKYAGNKIFWRFVDLPSAYFVFVTKIQRWRKRPRPRNEMLLRNWQTGSPHFLTARAKVKEPELVQFMKLSITLN